MSNAPYKVYKYKNLKKEPFILKSKYIIFNKQFFNYFVLTCIFLFKMIGKLFY